MALAAVFASPYWAALAVPVPGRRHRFFYQHVASQLGIDDGRSLRSMRAFDPLPQDIQEQARWGRLLHDPEWGAPPPPGGVPRKVLFIDITSDYERSIRKVMAAYGSQMEGAQDSDRPDLAFPAVRNFVSRIRESQPAS